MTVMSKSALEAATAVPSIDSDEQLDELLSRPTDGVRQALAAVDGDVVVLGAAGKMGPSLARMARRALDELGSSSRVVAVSRFSWQPTRVFTDHGIDVVSADLLDRDAVQRLPDAPNVVFMAGMKFGSSDSQPLTWAVNTYLPTLVCERYARSRVVAFSTGNVYPLSPLALGGSDELDQPQPVGEYAMSCLGRERMFEHFSSTLGTPTTILRLNYANELRYGIVADLAAQILRDEPISLAMGAVNVLWQGDANAAALKALSVASSPARVVNLAGPEQLSVRRLATDLARLLQREVTFCDEPADTALLASGQLGQELFGYPTVGPRRLVQWVAAWAAAGGTRLDKPTRFQTRDGRF